VLQQIQTLLQPSAAAVVADFYKLNIYGPGGFFKPHFDTPRSSDMFGSLVVCLPSPHSCGTLALRHSSSSSSQSTTTDHKFDWSTDALTAQAASTTAGGDPSAATATAAGAVASNNQLDVLGSLQWAAFYSDSEHEVLPVTDGYHITLTYNLRAVGQDSSTMALLAQQITCLQENRQLQRSRKMQQQQLLLLVQSRRQLAAVLLTPAG
jgi:hypothetical protein